METRSGPIRRGKIKYTEEDPLMFCQGLKENDILLLKIENDNVQYENDNVQYDDGIPALNNTSTYQSTYESIKNVEYDMPIVFEWFKQVETGTSDGRRIIEFREQRPGYTFCNMNTLDSIERKILSTTTICQGAIGRDFLLNEILKFRKIYKNETKNETKIELYDHKYVIMILFRVSKNICNPLKSTEKGIASGCLITSAILLANKDNEREGEADNHYYVNLLCAKQTEKGAGKKLFDYFHSYVVTDPTVQYVELSAIQSVITYYYKQFAYKLLNDCRPTNTKSENIISFISTDGTPYTMTKEQMEALTNDYKSGSNTATINKNSVPEPIRFDEFVKLLEENNYGTNEDGYKMIRCARGGARRHKKKKLSS